MDVQKQKLGIGLSNHLVGILNLVTMLLSIPILATGIWLATKHHTDCIQFLQGPVITLGLLVFLISLAGFVGAYWRITWLLWLYLFVMFLLLLLLFCFTLFAFAVTNKGAGEAVSGRAYKDYRLNDYSIWMQRRVRSPKNWKKIKSCLLDADVCSGLSGYKLATDFFRAKLTPIQSGCCKPPTSCNYLFLNATYWTRPLSSDADRDCRTYSYVQSRLCFECNSCKAGVIDKIKHDWRKVGIVNIVMLIFLVVVYSVGFHTFRKAQEEGKYTRYGKGFF